jgi:methionyl-tRNA synthetase
MSKSVGNVVSPFEQEEKFGAEVVRFYLLTGLTTYGDSPYKEGELINSYNARLANNYGNLLNRVIHLSNSNEFEINQEEKVESEFKTKVNGLKEEIEKLYEDYEIASAGEKIDELADFGNKYINDEQPWDKSVSRKRAFEILNNLSYLLKIVTELYVPIIPISTQKAFSALSKQKKIILFEKLES